MFGNIAIVLFFLLAPAAVLYLCKKISWIGKIGPILFLYILGIIVGNLFHPSGMATIQEILSSATIPLAIPLLLFSCKLDGKSLKTNILALTTGIASVLIAVLAAWFFIARDLPESPKIAAMLSGVYTGGTVNLASIKAMLGVSDELFILMNSCDMIVCALYLGFLISVGIRLFRKLLPVSRIADVSTQTIQSDEGSYRSLLSRSGIKDALLLLGVDVVIIGISAALGLLVGDTWFMTVLILLLTTLSLGASFIPGISTRKGGNEMGMYLIYIFSAVVASMADVSKFNIAGSLQMLGILSVAIFGSLLLQLLFSRIFKIDGDTTIAASVAFICSPPFVPMVTASMKNRRALVSGLAIGVVGYALGTYLGFLVYKLLSFMG